MQNKAHDKKYCGAKTRAGTPCKRPAGWGTKTPGKGRCKLHGGKSTGAPPKKMIKNSNAKSHGLFAKYLPKETMEIVNDIESIEPLEILWMNIKMQFASIIRSQQIMYVEDKNEMIKEMKKAKETMEGRELEFEFQFAWDRQATFMNSLSRSMAELRNMLKQYVEMANYDDDRLLEIKRMQSSIDKIKAEQDFTVHRTKQLKGTQKDTSMLDALIEGRKQYEQMMKERENDEQD